MGALLDGFEAARKEHENRLAEQHRVEERIDARLKEVSVLLDGDRDFLGKHGISIETAGRILHVNKNRSPIMSIHYDPTPDHFRMVNMRDNTTVTSKTAEECVRAIGGLLFSIVR